MTYSWYNRRIKHWENFKFSSDYKSETNGYTDKYSLVNHIKNTAATMNGARIAQFV